MTPNGLLDRLKVEKVFNLSVFSEAKALTVESTIDTIAGLLRGEGVLNSGSKDSACVFFCVIADRLPVLGKNEVAGLVLTSQPIYVLEHI